MANFSRFKGAAQRLIASNGADVTIRRSVAVSYDPVTDTETSGTPIAIPTKAVMAGVKASTDQQDIDALDLTYALGELTKFLMAGNDLGSFEPQPGDTVETSTDVWTVAGCRTVRPDNTSILHVVYAKRGAEL